MATVLQPYGVNGLAYPFYVSEYSHEPKPQPAFDNATLYCLETREQFTWRDNHWFLVSTPAEDPVTQGLLAVSQATNVLILRELRLLRQGQIAASTCREYDGPPEELDEPG